MTNQQPLAEIIDSDVGLSSKRKLLVITSIILFVLSFTGAKITGINTLIFELTLENPDGLGAMLVLSVMFLFVRYYSFAKPYHDELYKVWSGRLCKDKYMLEVYYCPDELVGVISLCLPKPLEPDSITHSEGNWSFFYECRFPFRRYIHYTWHYGGDSEASESSESIFKAVGFRGYIRVLILEVKYQLGGFINYREQLDILFPYIISVLAIVSFIFNDQFQELLKLIGVGSL